LAAPTVHDIPISTKATLADASGVGYREFRRGLKPRWARVWADLALAYGVLAAVVATLVIWNPVGIAGAASALGGALVLGYTIAFINNFFHEAAHYNVFPGRKANDVLTNALMGWVFGSSIALYRQIHFQHHRALGTTMDSENSYFDPLRVRYLVEGLMGLKVLRTLRRYSEVEAERDSHKATAAPPHRQRLLWLGVAASANGAIVLALAATGRWAAAAAWALGELAVFPFFVSLRQTLEHRAEEAEAGVDYRTVDHGAVNRLFGDGPVASTMGSAGFNRHALHHWEPQVSYTRLKDLERWLMDTELAPAIEERQTSYARTFLRLLEL
jgi:fatty acid desaturase